MLPFQNSAELPNDIPSLLNPIPFTLVNSQPLDNTDFLAPYVPCSPEIADAATDMLNLNSSDILCDLGCGDGRCLKAAFQKQIKAPFKSIGVELDPYLIKYCINTYKNLVSDGRLLIFEQDFLQFDLNEHGVTCLVLYLLPNALSTLEGKLARWIGADSNRRCVCITFPIPGWTAIKTENVLCESKSFGAGAGGIGQVIHLYDQSSVIKP